MPFNKQYIQENNYLYQAFLNHFSLKTQLNEWLDLLSMLELETSKKLSSAPEGALRISHTKEKVQYYHRGSKSEKRGSYISKNKTELIIGLAQKSYDNKLLKILQQEIRAVKAYLRLSPSDNPSELYEKMHQDKKNLIMPLIETGTTFRKKWEDFQYVGKPFSDNYPVFLTEKEERVRSKSEVLIADALTRAGIPYRYECPIQLKEFGTIYPDFTVLNERLRKEYFWEHLGRMDDPGYIFRTTRKMSAYLSNDYYLGDHLILTLETKDLPLNTRHIKKIIEHYFL